uniref:LITAF domain-containing protein n=1 Tax=Ditylenchus dipsaci TaxID=166011 RepID=A0A915CX81_9BILA
MTWQSNKLSKQPYEGERTVIPIAGKACSPRRILFLFSPAYISHFQQLIFSMSSEPNNQPSETKVPFNDIPVPVYTPQPAIFVVTTEQLANVGPFPMQTKCSNCQMDIVTKLTYESGTLSWLLFAMCFATGFLILITWFFCCFPFYIKSCMDVVHSCPNCNKVMGKHTRI